MTYTTPKALLHIMIGALALSVFVVGFVLLRDAPLIRAQEAEVDAEVPPEDAVNAELYAVLDRINSIEIDSRLFGDPAFVSLQDISTMIPAQPVGRDNPFTPISGSTVFSTEKESR